MPDNASRLLQRLLDLAESQGRCLAQQDWEGFVRLEEARRIIMADLAPLASGRYDLTPMLTKIAGLDAAHAQQLAEARQALQHEADAMRPQHTAVMAYYQGEYQPATDDARFIDQRD